MFSNFLSLLFMLYLFYSATIVTLLDVLYLQQYIYNGYGHQHIFIRRLAEIATNIIHVINI